MELDFDIETKSEPIEFEFMSSNVGGISETRVREIITEETKKLQPKEDNGLNTKSKSITGAINEVNLELQNKVHTYKPDYKDIDFVYAVRKQSSNDAVISKPIRAVSDTTPNSIIQRRDDGSADVKMPATPTEESIINKRYVDGYVHNLPDNITLTDDTTAEDGTVTEGTKTKWRKWIGAIGEKQVRELILSMAPMIIEEE